MPRFLQVSEETRESVSGFEAFSREQQPALLQFLRLRTTEEDARDIAQESLPRLLRYRDTAPASAWRPSPYLTPRNPRNEHWPPAPSPRQQTTLPVAPAASPAPAPPTHPPTPPPPQNHRLPHHPPPP